MSKSIIPGNFFLFIFCGILLLFLTHALNAQDQKDIQNILRVTNAAELKKFSIRLQLQSALKHAKAIEEAKKKGWMIRKSLENGATIELRELGRNGMPVYYITSNLNAAKTVSTNKLWTGGSAGLNLSGSGITLREWDESAPRSTHVELTGRVTQGDAGTYIATHSTHVAGTMLATGIDINAHGMANQAFLRAFDWNNDYAEMSAEAASGALLSNSSYGYITGWIWDGAIWDWYGDPSISPVEDYAFGFYGPDAASVDSITYYAPYYLPCKAAGNDRGEGPAVQPVTHYVWDGTNWVLSTAIRNLDGGSTGYDCLAHGWGVSKNDLTVGAVYPIPAGYSSPSDVIFASFSGTGPTDDGRIKPDIVADGINLYSTGSASDNAYLTMSGTSMATPTTTGSLALLQQHYHNLHGTYMRASTLKGVVLHTADEAGTNPGPDYMFGWGLLNTAKAASVISNNSTALIKEVTLVNGTTYTMNIKSNGTEPLRATICWTDPAGTPPPVSLNPPNLMLINDLDLRIDGNAYKPWVLNPASPSAAATTGDNFRDNVEQVYIANPGSGCHTLTVPHKGTLSGGSQVFSLVISGITIYPPFVPGLVSGGQVICSNTVPALLTGVPPTGGGSPYTYQWQSSPDSITFSDITSATGINFQAGPLSATTYYRQTQSSASSCNIATTNVIKVKVNPLPVPTLSGNSNLCINSGNYAYTTEPGMANYTWSASSGGIIISGAGTNSIQVQWILPGNQFVSVTYSNASGCSPGTPANLAVLVNPVPGAAQMISGASAVCTGSTGVLFSVPAVANAMTYLWTLPAGCSVSLGTLTDSILVDFSNDATSGNIRVYANNLCGNGIPSPDYPVMVIPVPQTPIIIQQGDSLISDAPAGNQWYNETGVIPGAIAESYYPPENGRYMDVVTINGCSSAYSNWFNFVESGIENKLIHAVKIFPNPADEVLQINLTLSNTCNKIIINLLSITGAKVQTLVLEKCRAGIFTANLPCSYIPNGIYGLLIEAGTEIVSQKIVIIHNN